MKIVTSHLDPTTDALVQELLKMERVEYDPTTIKRVSELPQPEEGLVILPIGTVFDDVVWLVKKAWKTLHVLVSELEVVCFLGGVLWLAGVPQVNEVVEIMKTGEVQRLAEFVPNISIELPARPDAKYLLVKLPSDMELVSRHSELVPGPANPLDLIAPSTIARSPSPDQSIAAAGASPSGDGNMRGSTSIGLTVAPAQLRAFAMMTSSSESVSPIPEGERFALVSSTGVSPTTMQSAVPVKFSFEDQANVLASEDIQIRRS